MYYYNLVKTIISKNCANMQSEHKVENVQIINDAHAVQEIGESKDQAVMTPWEVKGKINYLLQITKFGTSAIDGDLIKRWEQVTKTKAHHFIRRGIVFSHQDIDKLLDCVEQGIPIYLYTGRGPSLKEKILADGSKEYVSAPMHLGHLVPFKLTKYLQDALNCIVVIQMSDDEKFLFKNGSSALDLDAYRRASYDNAKDIIACGFDLKKTYIFSNLETTGGDLYFNNVLLMKATTMSTIKSTFGLGEVLPPNVLNILGKELAIALAAEKLDNDLIADLKGTLKKFSGPSASNVGQVMWPSSQAAPAFVTSFRDIFANAIMNALKNKENNNMPPHVVENMEKILKELTTLGSSQSIVCLVPMALDQSVYFRGARDLSGLLRCKKPVVMHSEFICAMNQSQGKMTTSDNEEKHSTLFLNTDPAKIEGMVKNAFSGGKESMKDHKKYGGDIRIDVCYQYLTFFLEDDEELKKIAEAYTSGRMSSGEIKALTTKVLVDEITRHQKTISVIDEALVHEYFNPDRVFDIGGCFMRDALPENNEYVDYDNYGINFDRTFGMKCADVPV